ncbi:MAG: recombination regulator RecX [Spirochaetaceae bacterium]|jgi:regulatory protein|nr:recombination regulator RecX [Spirochaetaceae bacterium]
MSPRIILNAKEKALHLLSRCEQCRASLELKLGIKGYSREEIRAALSALEEEGLLSDRRFAIAWLRDRAIHAHEGRALLAAHLAKRGIERTTAELALEEAFAERSEEERCELALAKYHRTGGKAPPEIHLTRLGFPAGMVRRCVQETSNHKGSAD